MSENNEWVATLINQLAEIRSQLETGSPSDYDYDLHQQDPDHVEKVSKDDDDQRRQRESRTHRLKRQIGGLLDNWDVQPDLQDSPGPAVKRARKGRTQFQVKNLVRLVVFVVKNSARCL